MHDFLQIGTLLYHNSNLKTYLLTQKLEIIDHHIDEILLSI